MTDATHDTTTDEPTDSPPLVFVRAWELPEWDGASDDEVREAVEEIEGAGTITTRPDAADRTVIGRER